MPGEPLLILFLIVIGLAIIFAIASAIYYRTEYRRLRDLETREQRMRDMIIDSVSLYREGVLYEPAPMLVVGQSSFIRTYFGNILPDVRAKHEKTNLVHQNGIAIARREAIVRLLEEARAAGYNAVCNLQLESTDLGQSFNASQRAFVIITATGTAYCVE